MNKLKIPNPLTRDFIEAHKTPPVSGCNTWSGVPDELGEYLYGVGFMLGLPTEVKPADEDYTKIVYTSPSRTRAIVTYNDEEGWEINRSMIDILLTGRRRVAEAKGDKS